MTVIQKERRSTVRIPKALRLPLAAVLFVACGPPSTPPEMPAMPELGDVPVVLADDPSREFDFWLGQWDVQNLHAGPGGRWRKTGSARATIQSVAGGRAILEQWTGDAGGRLIGSSLWAWNPNHGHWQAILNWHSGEPVGFFEMNGEREGQALHLYPPGGPRELRYTFSNLRTDSAQWSEATKRGDHWFTSWVMQFARREPGSHASAGSFRFQAPHPSADRFPETRELDSLIGEWTGIALRTRSDGFQESGVAHATVSSFIEGLGVLQFIDVFGEEHFSMLGYDPGEEGWVAYRAESPSPGLERLVGALRGDGVTFEGDRTQEMWTRGPDGDLQWVVKRRTNGDWGQELSVEFSEHSK